MPLPLRTPVIEVATVNAGVAPPEEVPVKPLAETTDTDVTIPAGGVCQVAAVELVAVRTCPLLGAVAPLITMVVVAVFNPLAAVAVAAFPVVL